VICRSRDARIAATSRILSHAHPTGLDTPDSAQDGGLGAALRNNANGGFWADM
jgi:hypothetical protein